MQLIKPEGSSCHGKPSRYRRRFFSRAARQRKWTARSNEPNNNIRYRRRFCSRAGRRNRIVYRKKLNDEALKTVCECKSLMSLSASQKSPSMTNVTPRKNWLLRQVNSPEDIFNVPSEITVQLDYFQNCLGLSPVNSPQPSLPQGAVTDSDKPDIPFKIIEKENNDSIQGWSFTKFRTYYLIVHTAIMLADGLQGTHLYVLYEGYGYSVAALYSLGFISGAFTSPFIGPFVDRIGRRKAAMLYCILEIIINLMEQVPLLTGLILSRVIGGVTTNLLRSVFESWLVTEHRKRGFAEEKLELILRDSTIASNSAAIFSGYIAHKLASMFGPVGPFKGAVTFTVVAFLLVGKLWSENFGNESDKVTTCRGHMVGAFHTIFDDTKILRIGLIQGFTEGSLQTFVYLWSPALQKFSVHSPLTVMGLDVDGEPVYGLIFCAFMACGVMGSLVEPSARKLLSRLRKPLKEENERTNIFDSKGNNEKRDGTDVGLLCAFCYFSSSILLLTPCLVDNESPYFFSICLGAFLIYEFMVGLYMPCEGVIRSIFMPNESICSLMTMLRVIVNLTVAVGVISTNFVSLTSAFSALSVMMLAATCLQLSLIPTKELRL